METWPHLGKGSSSEWFSCVALPSRLSWLEEVMLPLCPVSEARTVSASHNVQDGPPWHELPGRYGVGDEKPS